MHSAPWTKTLDLDAATGGLCDHGWRSRERGLPRERDSLRALPSQLAHGPGALWASDLGRRVHANVRQSRAQKSHETEVLDDDRVYAGRPCRSSIIEGKRASRLPESTTFAVR